MYPWGFWRGRARQNNWGIKIRSCLVQLSWQEAVEKHLPSPSAGYKAGCEAALCCDFLLHFFSVSSGNNIRNFLKLLSFSSNSGCAEYSLEMVILQSISRSVISSVQNEFMKGTSKLTVTFCNQKSVAKCTVQYKLVNENIARNKKGIF